MPVWEIAVIIACLLAGGFMKGAAGVGVPILALPAMSAFADLRLAVVVMLVPSCVTNIMQVWQFRAHWRRLGCVRPMIVCSVIGMVLGTVALAQLPLHFLTVLLTIGLVGFILLRLARPDFHLSPTTGARWAPVAGFSAAFMQGASGLSGPVILPFLSSMRLGREGFSGVISLFFLTMSLVQGVSLGVAGLVDARGLMLSVAALVPVGIGLALGSRVGGKLSPKTFDRAVLVILCGLAAKLVWDLTFAA